jgi:tetratricopeptide (TPR) repeat protein
MALMVGGATVVVAAMSRPPSTSTRPSDLRPVLLRPVVARTLSKPALPMLVTLLWLRSLNAIGQPDSLRKNLALSEYAQLLTDLDPRFLQAYVFLGLNIPYAEDRVWRGGDLASALFRKGLRRFPTDLRLHLYLGYSLMQHERRYLEAADVFADAARLPDALPFMAALATRLKAHGGDPAEGLALARELARTATDETLKAEMEARANELEVEIQLQRVDRALERFRVETGTDAGVPTLEALMAGGFYDGPAQDVRGGTIYIRDSDGKALSTSLERRVELFE